MLFNSGKKNHNLEQKSELSKTKSQQCKELSVQYLGFTHSLMGSKELGRLQILFLLFTAHTACLGSNCLYFMVTAITDGNPMLLESLKCCGHCN